MYDYDIDETLARKLHVIARRKAGREVRLVGKGIKAAIKGDEKTGAKILGTRTVGRHLRKSIEVSKAVGDTAKVRRQQKDYDAHRRLSRRVPTIRMAMAENTMDVVRSLIAYGTPDATSVSGVTDARQSLLEQLDGKSASTIQEPCRVCGSSATTRIRPSRQHRTPITRCPGCGHNKGPGANTVRGSTNYTGSPGSFYDESLKSHTKQLSRWAAQKAENKKKIVKAIARWLSKREIG